MSNNNNNNSTASNEQLVEDILSAKTLYDVLGLIPSSSKNNLEKSVLRKAYLTTSVKCHPDKNPHPQATQAFQRVAEAYNTLGDDAERAAYDAELRRNAATNNGTKHGRTSSSGSSGYNSNSNTNRQKSNNDTYYAHDFERTHMPSFQDALFMFATAASMFAGADGGAAGTSSRAGAAVSAASDFMETIFWAQQLAEGRQRQEFYNHHSNQSTSDNNKNRSNDNGNGDTDDYDFDPNKQQQQNGTAAANNSPLSAGMALGSGLRAIAGASRMMGLKKTAAASEKAATTVQVAAMGAAALQAAQENPAVRRTLERGSTVIKDNQSQIGKGIRASLKMAVSVYQAVQEVQQEEAAAAQQKQQQNCSGDGTNAHRNSRGKY